MKKLNHYFQKVSLKSMGIILVATMLLTTPRIGAHSVVGNYQKSSMAITANNNYQLYKDDKEKPVAPALVVGVVLMVIGGLAVVGAAAVGLSYSIGDFRVRDNRGQHLIYPDHINYSKYNFSQFDNTTVR